MGGESGGEVSGTEREGGAGFLAVGHKGEIEGGVERGDGDGGEEDEVEVFPKGGAGRGKNEKEDPDCDVAGVAE